VPLCAPLLINSELFEFWDSLHRSSLK